MKNIEDGHRSLRLLEEISLDGALTQRDLSDRVGVALGLVNTYMKNLVAKGYVKISGIPRKRYKYYLTPKGFVEKSRLTYEILHNYNRVFMEARRDYSRLFQELHSKGVREVLFAGADEVAEIAYLSLQEMDMKFLGVVDYGKAKAEFFKHRVMSFEDMKAMPAPAHIVVTTYKRKDEIYKRLLEAGADEAGVHRIYT